MSTAGRVYVLSAAIALVVMASRVGWIDWPTLSHFALVGMAVLALFATFLLVLAVVIGIPVALFMTLADRLWPDPEKQVEAPIP